MKKYIKTIITFVISILLIMLSFSQVEAANFTVSNSKITLDLEKNATVKIDALTHTGRINIVSSNTSVATVDTASFWVENNSQKITISAKGAGSAVITISGELYDSATETEQKYTQTINVTVNPPKQDENQNQNQQQTTPTPAPEPQAPVKQEPNFKNVNKTMYAEKDINLRESWSTSSKATSIDGGTELKVTATSTNKVNDYVWYKVSYNGKTYYVASNLLTDTKPEEKTVEEPAEEAEPEEQAEIGEEPIINEETEEHALSGLDILEIEGQTLSPKFKWNTYEYRVIVNDDISELNIKTRTVAKSGKAVIAGNKDLQEGENLITIVVYDVDGKVEATYQITVNKNTADLSGADKLLKNGNSEATRNLIIFLVLLVIAIIGLIVVIVLKRKKQIIDEDYEENYEEYVVQSTENEQIVENSSEEIYPEEIEIENLEEEPQPRKKREKRKGKHF